MTTLYLDRKNLEIRLDGRALALYESGQRRGTVPISLLTRIVVRGPALISTSVFGALSDAGIGFCALSGRREGRTAILPGRSHNDLTRRLAQYKLALDHDRRADIAAEIVGAKLAACRSLLRRAEGKRPDAGAELRSGAEALERLLQRLQPAGLLDIPTIRGIEGAGARAYFHALATLFPPSLDFHSRNRRPPRDPVNACLSLGYTLLHFDAVMAAQTAGLDPLLGIYHEPAFARDSLACDFVEPLRAYVDSFVWDLFRERLLTAEHFRIDNGACLLGKAGRRHFYLAWERRAKGLRRLLRIMTSRLERHLSQEDVGFKILAPEDSSDETSLY